MKSCQGSLVSSNSNGFTLIELTIALLIVSFLGIAMANYLRKSNVNMSSSDASSELHSHLSVLQKMLTEDIRQAAYINPSCATNPASSSATTSCSNLKIRGGIMPMPGTTASAIDELTNFDLPSNLEYSTSALSESSDALRLVVFNFSDSTNCRLNPYKTSNPSSTSGTATGAERFWTLREGCSTILSTGGLYIIMEAFDDDSTIYSNVFQVTALTDLGGTATSSDQLQIDAASTNNLYNQVGGLGLSGFTSNARIYPIKIIEWAFESGTGLSGPGLYRREISPSSSDLQGYGTWNLVQSSMDGIQFFPVTMTSTSVVEHQRTMQFTSDTANNGIEDILGVSVRVVLKSSKATSTGGPYDNPLTSTVEGDQYPRLETKFFINARNTGVR